MDRLRLRENGEQQRDLRGTAVRDARGHTTAEEDDFRRARQALSQNAHVFVGDGLLWVAFHLRRLDSVNPARRGWRLPAVAARKFLQHPLA